MGRSLDQLVDGFLLQEGLPPSYRALAVDWLVPLAQRLQVQLQPQATPWIIGISGAQGTGKSTAARFLCALLTERGRRVASVSLDDFYLSHSQRQQLAGTIHPLLASRGVPGTHDLVGLNQFINSIQKTDAGQVALPRFDKASDDPFPVAQWPQQSLPLDLLIIEGWFLGVQPQSADALERPVNALERDEDVDGKWRRHVNDSLRLYQSLFASLHFLVMFKAPSFGCVYGWRQAQEDQLIARQPGGRGIMGAEQLNRFIQHFERLTRHSLTTLPERADVVLELDESQRILTMKARDGSPARAS